MRRDKEIKFEFVEFIPSNRVPGTLYVSIEYSTVVHDCLCGCGSKVVTPLNPTGWSLTYDGETITLNPSIGNWNFQCRSHYIIDRNRIIWAEDMTRQQIDRGRHRDRVLRDRHYGNHAESTPAALASHPPTGSIQPEQKGKRSIWRRLLGR